MCILVDFVQLGEIKNGESDSRELDNATGPRHHTLPNLERACPMTKEVVAAQRNIIKSANKTLQPTPKSGAAEL
jgi:hypothetical protein